MVRRAVQPLPGQGEKLERPVDCRLVRRCGAGKLLFIFLDINKRTFNDPVISRVGQCRHSHEGER